MRPRHYVLIALIIGLGVFNYIRARYIHSEPATAPVTVPSGPVPQSASWTAFDKAVQLRDAPEEQFSPALQSLQQSTANAPTTDTTVADVKGCEMWLMFYRQGILHPSKDTSWRDRSTKHLNVCVQTHHDAG